MSDWINKIIERKSAHEAKVKAYSDRVTEINLIMNELRSELLENEITKSGSNIQPMSRAPGWDITIMGKSITIAEKEITDEQNKESKSIKEAIIDLIDKRVIW